MGGTSRRELPFPKWRWSSSSGESRGGLGRVTFAVLVRHLGGAGEWALSLTAWSSGWRAGLGIES